MYFKIISKRILSISLVFILLVSLALPAAAANTIPDISKNPYKSTLQVYVNRGLIKTYAGGNFKPSAPITRLEFMIMVNKALSLTATSQINYKDVKVTDWFYKDAQKGALYMKSGKNKLNPYGSLSRIDFAYALAKLGKMNSKKIDTKIINRLVDKRSISASNRGIVSAVLSRGLFKAFVVKRFNPNTAVSRTEAVVVLDRLLRQLGIIISDKSDVVTISSYTWTINNNLGAINNIPYNTSLATFKSLILGPVKGNFEVYQPDGMTTATTLATGCKLITTSESGQHKTYIITVLPQPLSSDASIKSNMWQINDNAGTIVNIPANTSLATFKSYIMPPQNGSYQIYLSDGYTLASNLTSGCKLITTAENGTHKTYMLSVISSTEVTVTSSKWIVNNAAETILAPAGTTLVVFKSYLAPPINGSYEVYKSNGITTATTLESGCKVITTAQTATYHKTYTIYFGTNASITSTKWTVNDSASTITNIPSGTTLTTFKSYITAPVGGSFQVYQSNGYTAATTLQTGYMLISTASDGTRKVYNIVMNAANTVTSSVYAVNNTAETITNVPAEDSLATFKANVTGPRNGTYIVYQSNGTSTAYTLHTGYKLTTTGSDGSHKTYTITLNAPVVVTSSKWSVNDSANLISGATAGTTLNYFKTYITGPQYGSYQIYLSNGTTVASDLQNGYKLITTSSDGRHKTYTISVSSAATVTSDLYYVNDANNTITGIPYGTSIDTFRVNIITTAGVTFQVFQPDGSTAANVMVNGCKLITTGSDGSHKTYTITVNASPYVTSASYTIDNNGEAITNVPAEDDLMTFKSKIIRPSGGSFEVYQSNATTVAQTLTTGCKLITTAQDRSHKTYTITLNAPLSTNANVTSTIYAIDQAASSITNIPFETTLDIFKSNVAAPANGNYKVCPASSDNEATGTAIQTGYRIISTAQNTSITKIYTITLNAPINLSSTKYAIDNINGTITNVPAEESLETFRGNVTAPAGGNYAVCKADGTNADAPQTGGKVIVTAQDGKQKTYIITLNAALSSDVAITSGVYNVNHQAGTITNIPASTPLTQFKSSMIQPQNGSFQVYQSDGTTIATDLQSGYLLITTAQNGAHKTYTISLNAPLSNVNTVTSTAYLVDDNANTITNVPSAETLATFISNITGPAKGTFNVYQSNGTTVASDLQSNYLLKTTAEDGSQKSYTIILLSASNPPSNP